MPKKEFKRTIDNSWTFASANTKGYTHCFHSYPAMMIPQVAGRLIREFKPPISHLLEPIQEYIEKNKKDEDNE